MVTLVDTGPLVAMCNRRDAHHDWTLAALASVKGALTTCEPVLTEACFLLKQPRSPEEAQRIPGNPGLHFVSSGLRLLFPLPNHESRK